MQSARTPRTPRTHSTAEALSAEAPSNMALESAARTGPRVITSLIRYVITTLVEQIIVDLCQRFSEPGDDKGSAKPWHEKRSARN